MELILSTTPAAEIEAGALVVICFEDETPPFLNDEAQAALTAAREEGEFDAKPLSTMLWHRPSGLKAQRLLAVGGGPRDKFDTAQMRKIAGLAVRTLKPKGIRDLAFRVEGDLAAEAMIEALAEGVILGDYEPNKHQTDPKSTINASRTSASPFPRSRSRSSKRSAAAGPPAKPRTTPEFWRTNPLTC